MSSHLTVGCVDFLFRSRKVYLLMLGYLLLLVLRVYWMTSNPIYSSQIFNNLTIVIGTTASIYFFFSDISIPVYDKSKKELTRRELHNEKKRLSIAALNLIVVALMFGAMLFITNWLYGEVSVLASITAASIPYHGG